jgi:hypothetical protein
VIDDAKELFGNLTDQTPSGSPNGFLALAEFDKPQNGGNGNGVIDKRDNVFSRLLVWIDANHDGVSQPGELHSLSSLGVYAIALKYDESGRKDQFGNQFRYRAAVNSHITVNSPVGPWAYDVFFAPLNTPTTASDAARLALTGCTKRAFKLPADHISLPTSSTKGNSIGGAQ